MMVELLRGTFLSWTMLSQWTWTQWARPCNPMKSKQFSIWINVKIDILFPGSTLVLVFGQWFRHQRTDQSIFSCYLVNSSNSLFIGNTIFAFYFYQTHFKMLLIIRLSHFKRFRFVSMRIHTMVLLTFLWAIFRCRLFSSADIVKLGYLMFIPAFHLIFSTDREDFLLMKNYVAYSPVQCQAIDCLCFA